MGVSNAYIKHDCVAYKIIYIFKQKKARKRMKEEKMKKHKCLVFSYYCLKSIKKSGILADSINHLIGVDCAKKQNQNQKPIYNSSLFNIFKKKKSNNNSLKFHNIHSSDLSTDRQRTRKKI